MGSTSESVVEVPDNPTPEKLEKEFRYYRQGMEYRTMKADKTVCHRSDLNRLSEGATGDKGIVQIFL